MLVGSLACLFDRLEGGCSLVFKGLKVSLNLIVELKKKEHYTGIISIRWLEQWGVKPNYIAKIFGENYDIS